MSQPRLVVVPLDDRMVNYECLNLLGTAAGYKVVLPPKEWLGTPWRSGQMALLGSWLQQVAPTATGLIVALDTLGYGGLINSRRSSDSAATVLGRLELLRQIKAQQPQLTILGYTVLMRMSRGNTSEEEKPYWGTYGANIFRLSVLEDRAAMGVGTAAEQAEAAHLRAELPEEVVGDYKNGRLRNHTINRTMIHWAADGIFDYLIVPQDDTVAYGWNIAEARALRHLVNQRGLQQRVSIYPGTDEIDMILLARHLLQQTGLRLTFWPRYSSVRHGQIITDYEDRPMEEVIKAQLEPLAGVLANRAEEADILLYVNAPAEVQGNGPDQYPLLLPDEALAALPPAAQAAIAHYRQQPHIGQTLRELHTPQRNLLEFARSLAREVAAGRSCAVVDVAYVNAGDKLLGDLLCQLVEVAQLAGYGGWNTAGNTLGGVLAQAVVRHVQKVRGATAVSLIAHLQSLYLRFVEDYLYMAHLRSQLMLEELPLLGKAPTLGHLGEAEAAVTAMLHQRLGTAAARLAAAHFMGRQLVAGTNGVATAVSLHTLAIDQLWLPWGRLFDLALTFKATWQ